MTLTLEQRRAYALEALNNPVLTETFDDLEAEIVSAWKAAQNTEAREEAWHKLRAAQNVRKRIESALNKADEAIHAEKEDED